jgi:hypothetical protein
MKLLFTVTLFSTAFLLFFVEPMVGKMVLPVLGGTPAIWNTCLLFFQTLLLAGYLFAFALDRCRGLVQVLAYLIVLALATVLLPIVITTGKAVPVSPALWLLWLLLREVGLPFFAVAAAGPLLQNWFARTDHAESSDPYFLYAASNLGSAIALLSYPFIWEPGFRLSIQSRMWAVGYCAGCLLIAGCGFFALRRGHSRKIVPPPRRKEISLYLRGTRGTEVPLEMSFLQCLRWATLAWIPSSLMLGVTSYLTMDVAAIPLLWVIPLLLYLITFVVAFSSVGKKLGKVPSRLLAPAVVLAIVTLLSQSNEPAWLILPLHLITFFLAALVCHLKLAEERPSAAYLTAFYLWVALGGWLGGILNVLIAPVVFSGIGEYPLALVAACFFRDTRPPTRTRWCRRFDWAGPIGVGALTLLSVTAATRLRAPASAVINLLIFGPAAMISLRFLQRPRRFAFALAAMAVGGAAFTAGRGREIYSARNFFGITRVMSDPDGRYHFLYHGETLHGGQRRDPAGSRDPLLYYVRGGPAGQVFDFYNSRPASPRVGLIGLGAGGLATYARANQDWTFYEINPAMQEVARNDGLFSFLSESPAKTHIVMGDARLQLQKEPDASFGLLVLDAFDSDSIPTHLVTQEAFTLYGHKLAAHGLLLFHISNRYLDLKPLLGSLCARLGLVGIARHEVVDGDASVPGIVTDWAVLAASADDLGSLAADPRWKPLPPAAPRLAWTDDYCNLLEIFRW